MAKILKLTLLNHLFYYTEITGGGASTTLTGGFIGDLALTYAFANALRPMEIQHRTQPNYGEIRDFGFYCTVARPLSRLMPTDIYTQNTLFTDGYPDLDSIDKSGKSPYKNYRQTQGYAIGSEFVALWLGTFSACVGVTDRKKNAKYAARKNALWAKWISAAINALDGDESGGYPAHRDNDLTDDVLFHCGNAS